MLRHNKDVIIWKKKKKKKSIEKCVEGAVFAMIFGQWLVVQESLVSPSWCFCETHVLTFGWVFFVMYFKK